jgi:hypothetical protein
MAITKETVIGKVEVVGQFKAVHVAMDTLIKENGNLIGQSRHRYCLLPDANISSQPQEVKDICNTAWTQEVKDAWNTFRTEQQENLGE